MSFCSVECQTIYIGDYPCSMSAVLLRLRLVFFFCEHCAWCGRLVAAPLAGCRYHGGSGDSCLQWSWLKGNYPAELFLRIEIEIGRGTSSSERAWLMSHVAEQLQASGGKYEGGAAFAYWALAHRDCWEDPPSLGEQLTFEEDAEGEDPF